MDKKKKQLRLLAAEVDNGRATVQAIKMAPQEVGAIEVAEGW